MLFFKKNTTLAKADLLKGMTDYHCHILPDVDDGIKHIEHTLQVLAYYEQIGIQKVWCTPHVMEDVPNTAVHLKERFEELKNTYHGTIKLNLASEYMLDNGFEERLNLNDLLCIQSSTIYSPSSILIETSYFNPPMELYATIARIREKGYQPLLAHPERYIYMENGDYERLKGMGVHFQCNITSLTGAYGKEASRKFTMFLAKGWIRALGTDIHRLESFNHAITQKCIDDRQKELLMAVKC